MISDTKRMEGQHPLRPTLCPDYVTSLGISMACTQHRVLERHQNILHLNVVV
jgi:hypothetical protein